VKKIAFGGDKGIVKAKGFSPTEKFNAVEKVLK
jgi:hypothetical protein